jgi:dTDP-4-amino-4,6-dideoxygalactose transaminase
MDIAAQYGPLRAEIDAAIAGVLDSGRFILGPHVAELEAEVSERLDGRSCVGVANGTDALVIALNALDVGPGDEVITTPYTFYATAEAIARLGATPVFCDIDPDDFCIDPDLIGERVTAHTRAILPVHIFGHAANMPAIRAIADRHGLPVIEDAAQAFGGACDGMPIGALADIATISFFPTKNLPGIGDGGMVVCRDQAVAERVRRLRFHGSADKVVFREVGYNSRLDEIQAAVIRIFLRHVDDWNDGRRATADAYAGAGLGEFMQLPSERAGVRHIYHLYMARHHDRDAVSKGLGARRVSSAVYYGIPMHLQPVFTKLGYRPGDLPVAEACAARALALPMHPHMTAGQVADVVEAVAELVGQVPARG